MACLFPLKGYRGEAGFVRARSGSATAEPLTVACGRCRECRLEKSRDTALRILHDVKAFANSGRGACFLTLTYDERHLPVDASLDKRALKLFHMRANKELGGGLRYYSVGEYGSENHRPHYHCIFTNRAFDDCRVSGKSKHGHDVYSSKALERLWPFGFVQVAGVSFQSAAYCARYTMKKVGASTAEQGVRHDGFGVVDERLPEFAVMSRRPGIGKPFFDRFWPEIYASDRCVLDGAEVRPPRFYDECLKKVDPALYEQVKEERAEAREEYEAEQAEDLTHARRMVKEEISRLNSRRLKREL